MHEEELGRGRAGLTHHGATLVALAVLALLCASLFVRLELDPAPLKALGHGLYDEGNWVHSARSRVLFGEGRPDDLVHARAGAPLFDLLQTASFRLFGVSTASARLVPTAALALIVVELYLLVLPVAGSPRRALAPVVLAGVFFELLSSGKYGTPLSLVALLVTTYLLLWNHAVRSGRTGWAAAAGLAAPLPILAKITAVYTITWIPVAIAVSWWARREVTRRQLAGFGFGAAIGTVLVGAVLATRWSDLVLLSSAASAYSLAPSPDPLSLLRRLLAQPFRPIFVSTGACLVMCLVFLRGAELAATVLERGTRATLSALSSAEAACWVWLGAGLVTLTLTGASTFERRTYAFLIPAVVLAGLAVLEARAEGLRSQWRRRSGSPIQRSMLVLLGGLLWVGSARMVFGGARLLNERWLSAPSHDFVSVPTWALAGGAAVAAGMVVGLAVRSWRTAALALAAACLAVNLGLDLCWYVGGSTTVRDASRTLAGLVADGEEITGPIAASLALETRARPVFWVKPKDQRNEHGAAGFSVLNPDWPERLRRTGRPVVITQFCTPGIAHVDSRYLGPAILPERTPTKLARLDLAPLPFSNRPRMVLEVWRLAVPPQDGSQPSSGSSKQLSETR